MRCLYLPRKVSRNGLHCFEIDVRDGELYRWQKSPHIYFMRVGRECYQTDQNVRRFSGNVRFPHMGSTWEVVIVK